MPKPSLTFFCEMDESALAALFQDGQVLAYLKKLGANLSLGMLDLSEKRAEVVKRLNKAGVPVTAWLLLPKERGYWTSLDTLHETAQKYGDFKKWQEKYRLAFAAIALDIEPRIEILSALAKNPGRETLSLIERFVFSSNPKDFRNEAAALINQIRWDGFAVETYQFPLIVDERAAKSHVLLKTLGLPSLDCDREVLMLYSSFFPVQSDSILWSYAKEAQAVGVGSTGGGVEIAGLSPLKTMRWIDLKRDLLLAAKAVKHVYIFSLEGCVQNRFMDRLCNLNWQTEVRPPEKPAAGIWIIRRVFQGLLWVFSHPIDAILGIIFIKAAWNLLRKITRV